MTKLIAQENSEESDHEFKDMIAWYNAQVFNWFNHNRDNEGDGPGSSGIDEVMNQIQDLDIAQGDDEDHSAALSESADTYGVCSYYFF